MRTRYLLIGLVALFLVATPFMMAGARQQQMDDAVSFLAPMKNVTDLTPGNLQQFTGRNTRTLVIFESPLIDSLSRKVNAFISTDPQVKDLKTKLYVYQLIYPSGYTNPMKISKSAVTVGYFSYDKLVDRFEITDQTDLNQDFVKQVNKMVASN